MDNLCHTLVGAALAESGLKRRTALGSATLMLAANLPDVDVLAVPLGHSLGFRRGVTHGLPAMIVLPILLTLMMLGWHRWRGRGAEPPRVKALLLLSVIGVATHPFLDWMNSYGMRWLMPVTGKWWYADTLFIIDPWIWIALAVGVLWSRRRETNAGSASRSTTPARVSLVVVGAYVAAMGAVEIAARGQVREALRSRGITSDTVVVEPVFASPVSRRVIYLWNGAYQLSSYNVLRRELTVPWFSIPLNLDDPAAAAANRTPQAREYHSWTRLPYYVIERGRDTTWVSIGDARYTLDGRSSWAVVRIPVVAAVGATGESSTDVAHER
jgi:inner membrane protein